MLCYTDAALAVRYTDEVSGWIWQSISKKNESPSRDHRKSLLIFWYMANIRKCVPLPHTPFPLNRLADRRPHHTDRLCSGEATGA